MYLNDFNFLNLKNSKKSTLIIFKHKLPQSEMMYYDMIESNVYNYVYFYNL